MLYTLLESIIIYLNSELSSSDGPFEQQRGNNVLNANEIS